MTAAGVATPAQCAACEAALFGRYCHACGQDSRAKPQPLREMAVEAAALYAVDSKLARTMSALLIRPHRLLNAYRNGAGSLYVTPLQLFVAATALFLAVLNFSNVTLFQYTWKVIPGQTQVARVNPDTELVEVKGAKDEERWLQAKIEPAIDPPILAALKKAEAEATNPSDKAAFTYDLAANDDQVDFAERLSGWLPNVLWILMPIYAAGLMLFFGRKRLFLEHVIFAMWSHAVSFMLMIALAGINSRGANLPAYLLGIPYLTYFTIAASHYYDLRWWSALWRGVAHMGLYLFAVLLPAGIIIYATVVDWATWWAWVSA